MNELITGYDLPHLATFSQGELDALADVLPKGLTYRMYGGEESRTFELSLPVRNFLRSVEGQVVYVAVKEKLNESINGVSGVSSDLDLLRAGNIPVKAIEYENERYLFDPPTWRDGFWNWYNFNFRKAKYYRELADKHILEWADWEERPIQDIINLPLKVNQNIGYKSYASQWIKYHFGFQIDLHVFGDDPEQFRANLEWYKANTQRKINIYEFNGLENNRQENDEYKNSDYHKRSHDELLVIANDVLGDQLGDVLYFTLASGRVSQTWSNPPYLHKYETKLIPGGYVVINTIDKVWTP